MKKYGEFSKYIIKGFCVGCGALIPGLSGGTVAIIVGVFEELLDAFGNIHRHLKKSLSVLIPSAIGIIASITVCAYYISAFCSSFPIFSRVLFNVISLCAALIFFILRVQRPLSRKAYVYSLSGLLMAFLITHVLNNYSSSFYLNDNDLSLILIGALLAVALVLPAISFSYMLLFVGMYERTLNAITTFDLIYLSYLTVGIIWGVLIFSKIFIKLTERYSQEIYCFIFGFVMCSSANMLV